MLCIEHGHAGNVRCTERRRLHRRDVTMDRAWNGRLERAGCVEQEERHDLRGRLRPTESVRCVQMQKKRAKGTERAVLAGRREDGRDAEAG